MTHIHPSAVVHPGAIVAAGARLGPGVRVGPWCSVGPDAVLEEGVELVSHVAVEGRAHLGAGVHVSPFTTIGLPPQDLKYKGQPTGVEIGPRTLIREGVTIHRGSVGGDGTTRVGADCMLMAVAHVGHDCRVADGVILANNVMLGGHVEVGAGAFVGGGAAVHQTVRIGRLAMVSGLSGVTNDIVPFGYVFGQPARLVGFNRIGLRRRGASRDAIRTVRNAVNLLFKEPGEFAARHKLCAERYGEEPLVAELLAFIRDPARRRELVRPGRISSHEIAPDDEEPGEGK